MALIAIFILNVLELIGWLFRGKSKVSEELVECLCSGELMGKGLRESLLEWVGLSL